MLQSVSSLGWLRGCIAMVRQVGYQNLPLPRLAEEGWFRAPLLGALFSFSHWQGKGQTMKITRRVKEILSWYESDNPGVKANLARMLMEGRLGGTGKMVILPVDQGFEHGPARSFAMNPDAYDPLYHYQLAIDAGLSAYAAPLGSLEVGAARHAGAIPLILKMNSANSLSRQKEAADQAVTASVDDALRLGCSAIGFTIYPGSDAMFSQYEEIRDLSREAKAKGIATVIWSYPRGGDLSKTGELAIDVVSYAAHMAALLGAHIIKVKLPAADLEQAEARKAYEKNGIAIGSLAERVRHVMQCCFDGRRIVVFSGGAAKGEDAVYDDARAIRDGGGHGSIIGRNAFQRSRAEALTLLDRLVKIYAGKE
jgi:fructose-bisphosphate aldolase, class I